jgi:hypothetical protein
MAGHHRRRLARCSQSPHQSAHTITCKSLRSIQSEFLTSLWQGNPIFFSDTSKEMRTLFFLIPFGGMSSTTTPDAPINAQKFSSGLTLIGVTIFPLNDTNKTLEPICILLSIISYLNPLDKQVCVHHLDFEHPNVGYVYRCGQSAPTHFHSYQENRFPDRLDF